MTNQPQEAQICQIMETATAILANEGMIAQPVPFSVKSFRRAQTKIESKDFVVPQTTISSVMRRFLFHAAYTAQPDMIYGAGTYVGFAFAWLIAGRRARPGGFRALGVDCDAAANAVARQNLCLSDLGGYATLRSDDAVMDLAQGSDPIDLLFIDVDAPHERKALYLDILLAAEPRLKPGALVLAHDPLIPMFEEDFAPFFSHLNGSRQYHSTVVLPLDACGISVSVKRKELC